MNVTNLQDGDNMSKERKTSRDELITAYDRRRRHSLDNTVQVNKRKMSTFIDSKITKIKDDRRKSIDFKIAEVDFNERRKQLELQLDISRRRGFSTRKQSCISMGHGRAKNTGFGVIRWTFRAILCSTLLIALVIGYSIIGAFLFRAVENSSSVQNAHQSRLDRQEYLSNLNSALQQLCTHIKDLQTEDVYNDTANDYNTTDIDNSTDITTQRPVDTTELPVEEVFLPSICGNSSEVFEEQLKIYEEHLTTQRGWRFDFRDKNLERPKWTFSEALLFSVTVMTTIGYGNLAPKTLAGRVATMLYAMLGIPLMLFCLAYIGNIWANVLRLIYTAFYRCCQRRTNKKKTGKNNSKKGSKEDATNGSLDPEVACETPPDEEIPVPAWLAFLILVLYIAGGSVLFSEWEGWRYENSIYFCFITFSTIGFGDLVPGDSISESDPQRAATCAIYILFGLATMSMVISVIQEDLVRVVYKFGNKIGLTKNKKPTG